MKISGSYGIYADNVYSSLKNEEKIQMKNTRKDEDVISEVCFENRINRKNHASNLSKEKIEQTEKIELSENEKLEDFKKKVWDEIDSMPWKGCMNISIQITDSAFKRMMSDEDFKNRMMKIIKEESIAAGPPGNTSLTWIDENGYKGFSYIDDNAGILAFHSHSKHKNCFYTKKSETDSSKEIWEKLRARREQHEIQEKKYWNEEYLKRYFAHQDKLSQLYDGEIFGEGNNM